MLFRSLSNLGLAEDFGQRRGLCLQRVGIAELLDAGRQIDDRGDLGEFLGVLGEPFAADDQIRFGSVDLFQFGFPMGADVGDAGNRPMPTATQAATVWVGPPG